MTTPQPPQEAPILRPAVLAFAHEMEAKLRKHDNRPGWKSDTMMPLHRRIYDELTELWEALLAYPRDTAEYRFKVRGEAADVANFAMMLADNEGALLTEGHAALAAPPQAAPHAAPLLPTQAALDSPRIDMPPSLSPEEKGAFMLGVAAGNVAAPHAVLVEAREALRPFANYACSPLGQCKCHNCNAHAAIASIERTLSQTQEPT
jgi:hypothetical protein